MPEKTSVSPYVPTIGLEIHAELKTRTKMFCGCGNRVGAEPNTLCCPMCAGLPGALPSLNAEAVRLAVRAGLALGCRVNPLSRFDRKNYFYPDLPKGYQITQYFRPLCEGGALTVNVNGAEKRVGITRIHMEEDAGKLVHTAAGSALDMNRCGVPLIEIVTGPDISSPAEAAAVFREIRELLVFAGVTEGRMNEGHLRCDVNLSLARPGEERGTRTETKNLNSFSAVERACRAEIARQTAVLTAGGRVEQTTMRLEGDAAVPMRRKEEPSEYRYFPEPDLPPLVLSEAYLQAARDAMPELPPVRRARYARELGVSPADAALLAARRECAEAFEAAASACRAEGAPAVLSRLFTGPVFAREAEGRASADDPFTLPFLAPALAGYADLQAAGRISAGAAKTLVSRLFDDPAAASLSAEEAARAAGLLLVTDPAALSGYARAALAAEPALAGAYRAGKTKVLGAILGKAMALSGGAAEPCALREAVVGELDGGEGSRAQGPG